MLDINRLRVIDAVARHGSVTAAAKELHYSQPSVTHHLARLEAETGAQLLQRVGRGIRLTPAGQLLAERAAEIIGRIDAAGAELSAQVGLTAGRVRLAAFASAIGSLVPAAVAALASRHPNLQISLTDTHPPEAIDLLRTGKIDVAIIFRYDETEPEPAGVRLHHLLDDPVYVLSRRHEQSLADLRDTTWIAGCERCRSHLLSVCADAGFHPRIGYSSDDMVVMMALVAAGLGVATQSGLALRAHHIDGVVATELPNSKRHIYAVTYGEPPDPPATAALLAALAGAATSAVTSSGQNQPRSRPARSLTTPPNDVRAERSHARAIASAHINIRSSEIQKRCASRVPEPHGRGAQRCARCRPAGRQPPSLPPNGVRSRQLPARAWVGRPFLDRAGTGARAPGRTVRACSGCTRASAKLFGIQGRTGAAVVVVIFGKWGAGRNPFLWIRGISAMDVNSAALADRWPVVASCSEAFAWLRLQTDLGW